MDRGSFIENLSALRKSRGLTQKQVADGIGVSDRTYSKWETGERTPDIDAVYLLADFYKESPAVFFAPGQAGETDGRAAVGKLPLEQAAQAVFQSGCELIRGLCDSAGRYPAGGKVSKNEIPCPSVPEYMRMPDMEASVLHFAATDLMALIAAGPDANLALLLLPNEEKNGWLDTEAEALRELFGLLSMPGAANCLRQLMSMDGNDLCSAGHIARQGGIPKPDAAAFLEAAAKRGMCGSTPCLREKGEEPLYSGVRHAAVAGILTLGRLLLSADPERPEDRRGHVAAGIPGPLISMGEKT